MPEVLIPPISDLAGLSDAQAALKLTERMSYLDGIRRTAFFEMAWIAREFSERQLWQYVQTLDHQPYHSLNHWIAEACPYSRAHVYAGVGLLDELEKDIPLREIMQLNESNARVLRYVSSAVRREPEVIEAAKTLSEAELVEKIAAIAPEQHLERSVRRVFKLTASQDIVVDQAVKMAIERDGGCAGEVLFEWAQDYLSENLEAE